MLPGMPNIVEGEIISVQKPMEGDFNVVRYTCHVTMPNGALIVLENVEEASMFGGIADYQRRRARSREDADYPQNSINQTDLDASVGERVLIAFVNGFINAPIIVGYRQHPNQIDEPLFTSDEKPSFVKQLLGVRETIDEVGNYRMTRKGAPNIVFASQGGITGQTQAALTSALGGLGVSVPSGDDSAAVEPKDEDERLVVEILDKALYRVRDPKGAVLEFDHDGDKKGVYISNNDWTSSEDVDESAAPSSGGLQATPEATDAEYIWLNRAEQLLGASARSLLKFHSSDKREDTTNGKFTNFVKENYELSVEKDYIQQVTGAVIKTVEKEFSLTANPKITMQTKVGTLIEINDSQDSILLNTNFGDILRLSKSGGIQGSTPAGGGASFVLAEGKVNLTAVETTFDVTSNGFVLSEPAGATLKLESGQVALGNPNLPPGAVSGAAAEVLDILDKLCNLLAVEAPAGFGAPLVGALSYADLAAVIAALKGSL